MILYNNIRKMILARTINDVFQNTFGNDFCVKIM